jgi:TldD protein
VEPLVALSLDEVEWKRRIAEASGLFLTEPSLKPVAANVQYSTANVRGLAVNRYLVNSEGTVLRHGYAGYNANYSVGGQADDGMRLARDNGTTAAKASQLEDAAAFRKRVLDDVQSFEALREAPVADAEDFHGPVLFSGDASAGLLNQLFVPNVQANRPEMGTAARTEGAYRSSLHARVLPEMLDVKDDPLLAAFAGKALVGAYDMDDEGVPAQAVDVVEKGKLDQYLIGRTPVRDLPVSNGHGRAAPGQAAHPWAGVMIFKAETPTPAGKMEQKLVALAKEQSRDVYVVETMGGDSNPRLLYRVHPNGARQLVRGAVFDELDLRSLRSDILAVGDDAYVAETIGPIPETTIAPSLLFGDIGVKRANEEQQKLPYYAPPQ